VAALAGRAASHGCQLESPESTGKCRGRTADSEVVAASERDVVAAAVNHSPAVLRLSGLWHWHSPGGQPEGRRAPITAQSHLEPWYPLGYHMSNYDII
jgi:hypothetical protein